MFEYKIGKVGDTFWTATCNDPLSATKIAKLLSRADREKYEVWSNDKKLAIYESGTQIWPR